MSPPSLAEVRQTFIAFRNECIWMQTCFNTFHALYHGGSEVDEVLRNAAPIFFVELNTVLAEYWVLIVCRLTDSARSTGHENLTVNYLVEALAHYNLLTEDIHEVACNLHKYRTGVIDARNKVVSHADRRTFLQSEVLGAHAEEAVDLFVRDMQRFNDLVGEAIQEGPLDYQVTSCSGDVYDLLRGLNGGRYLSGV